MKNKKNISVEWKENLQFIATNDKTDAQIAIAVKDESQKEALKGTEPKYVFLQGLAGCSAGAIIFLLQKMRVEMPTAFKMDVSGTLTTEHPMFFKTIDITYHFEGNTDIEMLKKVVKMSEEKYCGLTYMLSKVSKINIIITKDGKTIER
ncbi:MAG TPA: OsmC family protein [Bacteroidales bacterium]|nr:OsmC family protein [Bacteroidales bacterium]